MTKCKFCPRPLNNPESQRRGYGEVCGRRRGLIRPKPRRARPAVPRLKPATVPPAPDALPGQTELDLFHHQPTLDSI
ncbi:DUF6011 domain-containing protein [Streptomyces sp. NPDC021056]|uniref:DUF6011 domain-containing protein n=1 Tax=Streptomyces sp. NPDC021056 TaxID=3155012 RepID=UPI003410EAD3